uniref:Uncharacterized protein n=1 Tax=Kalanchoe fedtschenkoi TaxID=63787 RepID=A0A7N0URD1_KALFE
MIRPTRSRAEHKAQRGLADIFMIRRWLWSSAGKGRSCTRRMPMATCYRPGMARLEVANSDNEASQRVVPMVGYGGRGLSRHGFKPRLATTTPF